MFYLVHVLAGALVAKFFPNFILIIILSLLSHFILDIIPHRDTLFDKKDFQKEIKLKRKAVLFELLDISISIILIIYVWFYFKSILMLFSIFISLLPDILKLFYLTKLKNNRVFKKYLEFHLKIQTEVSWKLGIIIQFIIILVFLFLLL